MTKCPECGKDCEETKAMISALRKLGADVLEIDGDKWKSPASYYNTLSYGSAKIIQEDEDPGVYLMEGVDGHWFYAHSKPMPQICLQIDGETWMVDNPTHTIGMRKLAEHARGKVLCGGLGLGLLQNSLADQEKVTQVDTVEINPDVIGLMKDNIPKNFNIYQDDYYNFIKEHTGEYDTIICDIFVRSPGGKGHTHDDMVSAYKLTKFYNPMADVYFWGFNDKKINPACKDMPKKYFELRKAISEQW